MNARKWVVAVSVALLLVLSLTMTASAAGGWPPAPGFYYTVHPGDTLFSIAVRYGTTVWTLARANGLYNPSLIFSGQVLFIPAAGPVPPVPPQPGPGPGPVVHIVRYGETMFAISRMYGVSVWSIAQANGIANPSYIFAGQRLIIPTGYFPQPTYYNTPGYQSTPVYNQPWYPSGSGTCSSCNKQQGGYQLPYQQGGYQAPYQQGGYQMPYQGGYGPSPYGMQASY